MFTDEFNKINLNFIFGLIFHKYKM